jgi:hypothetical protein
LARQVLCLSRFFHSFSTTSSSSSVMAAKFHHITCTWSAYSWLSTLNSHSITTWSDPVAFFPSSIVHCVIGLQAKVRPFVDAPSSPVHAQW